MREIQPGCPNFLDKNDSRFKKLHGALRLLYFILFLNSKVWYVRVLTEEDEEKLWESGVLGTAYPKALQNAVFHTIGKGFSLRGGTEL